MASPAARHLAGGPARVLRVHDRGQPGARRDAARAAWRAHGAELVGDLRSLVAGGDLDVVVVCCGKNGDDLPLVAELGARLARAAPAATVLHLSTVSTGFARAAHAYCGDRGIAYANYPLTGGPLGAERGGGEGGMLILAGGDRALYDRLRPTLERLGHPRHLGARVEAGAETKLIGHHMVFDGCIGMSAAVALHAEGFAGGAIGGDEQVAFFDFLNGGAGGTRQWEVALAKGVRDGVWDQGFMLRHAVVDAIYAADLAIERGLPRLAVRPILDLALAFSHLMHREPDQDLATHAVARQMLAAHAAELDAFASRHGADETDPRMALQRCVASLPDDVRASVRLDVEAEMLADAARGVE